MATILFVFTLWTSDVMGLQGIRGFGAAIGHDSSCFHFGHHKGVCFLRCMPSHTCENAVRVCQHLSPQCVGIAVNKEGTLATLKAHLSWMQAPADYIKNQSWWRLDECRKIRRKAKRLTRGLAVDLQKPSGSTNTYRQSSEESKLLHLWNTALCDEYIKGPMVGRARQAHRFAPKDSNVHGGLVMDVGFADGSDTAMFLRRGFTVVAVEADSATIKRAQMRHPVIGVASFGEYANRLRLENVAIANQAGNITFFSPAGHPDMASIHESTCKGQNSCKRFLVRATTCASLMAKHGVPLVLKIDVEGADRACLNSLSGMASLPPFVAVEDNNALDVLASLGYTHFKLVAGRSIAACDVTEPTTHLSNVDKRIASYATRVPNSLGGMPWECANTIAPQPRSWSTASDVRGAPHFNHEGGGWDLYAWRGPSA